jgi:hypothetical protein
MTRLRLKASPRQAEVGKQISEARCLRTDMILYFTITKIITHTRMHATWQN